MAKSFKVQQKPTFKSTVDLPIVGGDPMKVTFTFKTFDRIALARISDKWKDESMELLKESQDRRDDDRPFTLEEWTQRELDLQVAQIKDVVEGWGFSDEFSDENIRELAAMSVSMTDAILNNYNEAYTRARTGN